MPRDRPPRAGINFHSGLWRSELLTRPPYDAWEQPGAKDMAQRIQEKLIEILDTHTIQPLQDTVSAAIEKIRVDGEDEFFRVNQK